MANCFHIVANTNMPIYSLGVKLKGDSTFYECVLIFFSEFRCKQNKILASLVTSAFNYVQNKSSVGVLPG